MKLNPDSIAPLKFEIPGPDLARKDRVLWLPLPKYYSGNMVFEASRARAGRISKYETILKYQMTETFKILSQNGKKIGI